MGVKLLLYKFDCYCFISAQQLSLLNCGSICSTDPLSLSYNLSSAAKLPIILPAPSLSVTPTLSQRPSSTEESITRDTLSENSICLLCGVPVPYQMHVDHILRTHVGQAPYECPQRSIFFYDDAVWRDHLINCAEEDHICKISCIFF